MSVLEESYTIDATLPDYISVDYRSTRETKFGPADFNCLLWFERPHLPWLIDALQLRLTAEYLEKQQLQAGHDFLKVSASGPEQAPYINLDNVRPEGVPHAGDYWVSLTKPLAQQLLDELRRLVDAPSP